MTQTLPDILKPTPYSPAQTAALTDRRRDVVVKAGAGAGKTRTLVARYLSLLAEGLPLRSIVAITFTRKAAREMRNRVRESIRTHLEQPDLDPTEMMRWREAYRLLDSARISTIHGLCSEILRAHPAEAALDPRFEVLDEAQNGLLRQQVQQESLAWAADQPDLAPLFTQLGEGLLIDCLTTLLKAPFEAERSFAAQPENLLSAWQSTLSDLQGQYLARFWDDPAAQEALAILRDLKPLDDGDKLAQERAFALNIIAQAKVDPAALGQLSQLKSHVGSQKNWPGGALGKEEAQSALKILKEYGKDQPDWLTAELNQQDERLALQLPRLRRLFAFAQKRLEGYKDQRNALDFDDLETLTLRLLTDNPAVRHRWQNEIRALLVDEFQDTNRRQLHLINHLHGPQTARFLVGDAKQSIYRFRGADVTVFREQEQRTAARHILNTSYRAHHHLLTQLNQLLEPILGSHADPSRPYAEPFAPLTPHRDKAKLQPPFIELHLGLGSKSDGALDRSAAAIAQRLQHIISHNPRLTYSHAAILCRASTSFAAYENALETVGIPFLTVAGRGFYHRPEIRDLLNILRTIADPSDDLALSGLLRSPVFSWSDKDIFTLTQRRTASHRSALQGAVASAESLPVAPPSLWQTLKDHATTLPAELHAPTQRVLRLVSPLNQQAGRTAVADLLKAFLDASDYQAALLHAGQSRAARNVAKLLVDAHTSGLVSVQDFLLYVDNLRDSGSREGEARAIAEGVVQIMTIHAAKGLEFPIVVLGDLARPKGRTNSILLDEDLGLLFNPPDMTSDDKATMFTLGQWRDKDRAEAETARLLYVAATRAADKLILSGTMSTTSKHKPTRLGEWLGQLAEPLGLKDIELEWAEDGQAAHRLELASVLTAPSDTPTLLAYAYEPGWTAAPPPQPAPPASPPAESDSLWTAEGPPLLKSLTPAADMLEAEDLPQRVWQVVPPETSKTAPAWVVGQLVHAALAGWWFPHLETPKFVAWAKSRVAQYGLVSASQTAHAVRQTRQFLRRFQSHPRFTQLNLADERLHEVPYMWQNQGQFEQGYFDTLYRRGQQWTIVDFKTDHLRRPEDLAHLRRTSDYWAQVSRYQQAATALLGQRPQAVLCFLDYQGEIYEDIL